MSEEAPTVTEIPKIAITQDEENYEDEDDIPGYQNIAEALTDVEDLYDDDVAMNHVPKNHKKLRLKIRLNENPDLTDLEDFEASDNEDDSKSLVLHKKPISLDELDLEGGTIEESFKTEHGTEDGANKLKTQLSVLELEPSNIGEPVVEAPTDEELFDTDSEVKPDDIPEINIELDGDGGSIFEKMDSSNPSKRSPNKSQGGLLQLSNLSLSPNLSDLTDIEVLNSDSEDEESCKKSKTKRRKARMSRRQSVTDVEDLDMSDEDSSKFKAYTTKPKKKTVSKGIMRSHSLQYDSDNEDTGRLPFPVCKRVVERKQLSVPCYEPNFGTDVEEMAETDDILTPAEIKFDEVAFEQKMDEMSACYFNIEEKHDVITQKDSGNECAGGPSHCNHPEVEEELPQMKSTDEEEMDEGIEEIDRTPELELPPPIRTLVLLNENESFPVTQILPLDAGNESDGEIHEAATDEENLSELELLDESEDNPGSNQEVVLPDFGNVSAVEKIKKVSKLKKEIEPLTDTEEIVVKERRRRAPKFKYMHEKMLAVKQAHSPSRNDDKTDTEDIYLSDENEASTGKTKVPMFLTEPDAEEMNTSLSPLINMSDGGTDLEYLGDTSCDDRERSGDFRAMSCTPQHMREIGGVTMVTKEGIGAFSFQDRLTVNKSIKNPEITIASPTNTDVEDLVTSEGEDALSYCRAETATPSQVHVDLEQMSGSNIHDESKKKFEDEGVMYLKGGGYVDDNTDIEDIIFEDELNSSRWEDMIRMNFVDGTVSFGGRKEMNEGETPEWETTKQEIKSPALGGAAAQKGGEVAASSSASASVSARDTTTSGKAEGEEGLEKEEAGRDSSRKVADQHQLSDEMKELLKELEKESKQ